MNKSEIRKEMLDKRLALTQDEVKRLSKIICSRISSLKEYKTAKDVCLYMPIKNEVDVKYIMETARKAGKNVYIPKVKGKDMDFYIYDENTRFTKSSFGIQEPDSGEILIPDEHTLVVMPGAAFSEERDRIGYGGGYYDRYLKKYNMCMTAGVCYSFQILDKLPAESYDIKPDAVVSDEKILL